MATYDDARTATDELVRKIEGKLEEWTGITPHCIIKGGSLGHGTAVPGEFDLDLVIYTNDIEKQRLATLGVRPFREWLTQIKEFLAHWLGPDFKSTGDTPHAICFAYKDKIDVDLLVSPVWEDPFDFYHFLTRDIDDERKRFSFSVGASKWQVEFYSHQPSQVKEYARRAKAWRNEMWSKGSKEGKPKSYFLSLLVLRAYEIALQMGVAKDSLAEQTTTQLKQLVKNHHELNIYWEEYYKLVPVGPNTPQNEIIERSPRILDPANPYNNLYKTGIGRYKTRTSDYEEGDGNWTLFVKYIDTVDLAKPVD